MRKNKILPFISILIFTISVINNCSYFPQIAKLPPIYEDITPEESFRLIQQHLGDEDFVILDVRTPEEIDKGYIKNSKFIDFKSDNFIKEITKLDKTKIYLIYCKGGVRSEEAMQIMERMKFEYLYNMLRGFDEWKELEFPQVNFRK